MKNALYGKGQGMYCTCPVLYKNEYNYSKYCSFEYEILKNIERKKTDVIIIAQKTLPTKEIAAIH